MIALFCLRSSFTAGALLYGNGTSPLGETAPGNLGDILQFNGTFPTWVSTSSLGIVAQAAGSEGEIQFSALANRVLTEIPAMLQLKEPDKMPAGALAALWHGTRARLFSPDDAIWQLQWSPTYDPLPEPAHTYLVIDVETLFREAFERASESVNEGIDDEDNE